MLFFLLPDNENRNKAIANKFGIPMIGFASHRLNLCDKKLQSRYSNELQMVQMMMKKLRGLKKAATWIPATTNVIERLFSTAKIVFDDHRKSALGEILFLKFNRNLWSQKNC